MVAVHANAHYTYIFDGTAKLFCPLPISDVEARLDTSRFLRVHRSHIVNIERVRRLKRAGDSGMVELDAADAYAVPVSRSRVGWLKSRMGSRPSEIAPPIDVNSDSIADAVRANHRGSCADCLPRARSNCRCSAHFATLECLKNTTNAGSPRRSLPRSARHREDLP